MTPQQCGTLHLSAYGRLQRMSTVWAAASRRHRFWGQGEQFGMQLVNVLLRPYCAADSAQNAELSMVACAQVEHVKERCLPGGLNYPMLEEYDFRNDDVNAPLPIELKPVCTTN